MEDREDECCGSSASCRATCRYAFHRRRDEGRAGEPKGRGCHRYEFDAVAVLLSPNSEHRIDIACDLSNVGSKGQAKRPAGSVKEGNRFDPRGPTIDKFFSSERPGAPSAHNGRLPSKAMLDDSLRLQPALRSNAAISTDHRRSNLIRTVEAAIQGNSNGYGDIEDTNSYPRPSTTDDSLPICAEETNDTDRTRTDSYGMNMGQTFRGDEFTQIGDKVLFQDVPNGTTEGA